MSEPGTYGEMFDKMEAGTWGDQMPLSQRLRELRSKANANVDVQPWQVYHDQYFTMNEKTLMVELVNNTTAIIAALEAAEGKA